MGILGPLLAIGAAMAPALGLLLLDWIKGKTDPRNVIQTKKDENRTAIIAGTAGDLIEQRLNRLPPSSGKSN